MKYIFLILIVGVLSFMAGYFYKSTNYVLVSDRITECENKGGKYRIWWFDYRNIYEEECETVQKNIDF